MTDSTGREVVIPLNRMPSDRNPATKAGESFDWGPWDVPDRDFGDTKITDWAIGRLLDELDRSPYKDNTIVILWSDHGWQLGEKEHWGKWTGLERSTKVPLIIAPPSARTDAFAPAGSSCDQPVGLIDLFPTLAELCDVPAPEGLQGTSLVPLLREPKKRTGRRLVTYFNPGNYSVRTERWRYILYQDGSQELYDHNADPHEWNNLAENPEHENIIRKLREGL